MTSHDTTDGLSEVFRTVPAEILAIAAYATIILAISSGIAGLIKYRPRVHNTTTIEYIDSKTRHFVQKKTFELIWGWGILMFVKKIGMHKFPENYSYRISYKPEASYEKPLSSKYFEEKMKSGQKKLHIKDKCFLKKCFFMKNGVKKISLLTSGDSKLDYESNISTSPSANTVEIFNENTVEIRNFRVELPHETTADRLSSSMTDIQEIEMNEHGMASAVVIKSLPAIDGTTPGKVTIVY